MTYWHLARITPDSEAYSVRFPDVPHCYTFGETIEEAIRKAEEVLALHLSVLQDSGKALPTPSSQIPIQPTDDEYAIITCELNEPLVRSAG